MMAMSFTFSDLTKANYSSLLDYFFLQISSPLPIRNSEQPYQREDITKTRLFKYIENFTPKTENFQIKKTLIFFIFLLKS